MNCQRLESDLSTDQLRQDLEAVYNLVQTGWKQSGYGAEGVHSTHGHRDAAICVGNAASRISNSDLCHQVNLFGHRRRYDNMLNALGFEKPHDLYNWNDHRDTWEMVQDRVKDAIGKL